MEFSCEKAVIQEAVAAASRTVSQKSTIQALEGLLITADDHVVICGYDLKTAIQCSVPASVSGKGSVVINARIFGDIIRKLPDSAVYFSCGDNNVITIKCGKSEFNIIGFSADEFPKLPEVDRDNCIKIEKKLLKSMISQTIFAVSTDVAKPVHTGSKFEISNGCIQVISVDGFRLAVRNEHIEDTGGQYSFIVPGDALKEIERLIGDSEDEIKLFPDKKFILFDVGDVVVITRLLEGEFLNYQKALPDTTPIVYQGEVRALLDSVERVSLLVNEKMKTPLRCLFEEGMLKLSCITSIGKSYDECALDGFADTLEIGFNARYILDVLRACPDENIMIKLKSDLSPCVITPVEGDSFLYLILPVRLK